MSKEIEKLHEAGFVLLHANRTTNSPIGWKQPDGSMGYKNEMSDPTLEVYRETFNAKKLSLQHCGFYLGYGGLCCVDLDVKKTSSVEADKMVKKLLAEYPGYLVAETTKSNGWHLYFLYEGEGRRNEPKFFSGIHEKNWIELYFNKRFIGCWLSATKKYVLKAGDLLTTKRMSEAKFKAFYADLSKLSGRVVEAPRKRSGKRKEFDDSETQDRVRELVEEIVRTEVDITGKYHDWFGIGKGIAGVFGHEGFELFNSLSKFSPSYNADTIEDVYNTWVEEEAEYDGKGITIATFFDLCKKHGVGEIKLVRGTKKPAGDEGLHFNYKESIELHVGDIVSTFFNTRQIVRCRKMVYQYNGTFWERLSEERYRSVLHQFAIEVGYTERMASTLQFKKKLFELAMIDGNYVEEMGMHRKSFNLLNGVLTFNADHTIKFEKHSPDFYFTYQLDYSYDPQARCPLFEKVINRVMPNEDNQRSLFKYIASIFSDKKIEKMFFLIGGGSNGKSTIMAMVQNLFGGACTETDLYRLTSPDHSDKAMYHIWDKLIAVSRDDKGINDPNLFKKIASREPLRIKSLWKDDWVSDNYARIIVGMNTWPNIEATMGAKRRFIGVEMNITIPSTEWDLGLDAKIMKERSGILNVVIAQHINTEDMFVSREQLEFADRVIENSDHVMMFLKDSYELLDTGGLKSGKEAIIDQLAKKYGVTGDPTRVILHSSLSEMYQEFRTWCTENGVRNIMMKKTFSIRVRGVWGEDKKDPRGNLGYYLKKLV